MTEITDSKSLKNPEIKKERKVIAFLLFFIGKIPCLLLFPEEIYSACFLILIITRLETGVLLPMATLSIGTSTLVSG